MYYDVIIIGAGLSGLSSAALLAKRGLSVAVIEHSSSPGGSCGIFKRDDTIFDQGAAMLFGFGEKGFNSHRFLFNCLEEPFYVVKHKLLYTVHYKGHIIKFHSDIKIFVNELAEVFPDQKKNILRFYNDMKKMYDHVISETPSYTTPDETDIAEVFHSIIRHPISYLKFLSYLNISAEQLLKKYFSSPEIFAFFDKLTSTYCYSSVAEAPAILATVMFIDNHEGGSYYPVGSTLYLPGKLEKVIEENHGDMIYNTTVSKILFKNGNPYGVITEKGEIFNSSHIIYSGSIWNLYGQLLPENELISEEKKNALSQVASYPSLVLYTIVKSSTIPEGTCPIEMLASDKAMPDENELTLYIMSIDEPDLCPAGCHIVTAIGPSLIAWSDCRETYELQKKQETERILCILENHFPGFKDALMFCELATPKTIERYTMKKDGSVAGPKQMLGQHMLKRQHIRTQWPSLLCCGESTPMGTGTPAVTSSAIAAANAVLKDKKLTQYKWRKNMKNFVTIFEPPVYTAQAHDSLSAQESDIISSAARCMLCSKPSCCVNFELDIPGIMRRVACGNFSGASRLAYDAERKINILLHHGDLERFLNECEKSCKRCPPVSICNVINFLLNLFSACKKQIT